MAGHVHDVGKYAPEGFALLCSNYADGKVTHVFGEKGTVGPLRTLECVVTQHEDEEAALKAFQARYAPTIPAPAEPTVKAKRGGK